jgi:aromatic-L-amino-acid decarboxylase
MAADKITSSASKRMTASRYGQLQVGTLRIAYQDATCSLWVNAYKVPLSPTEYRVCAALLQRVGSEPLEPTRLPDGNRVLAWVPRQTLLQVVGGRHRHRMLSRQISNLNNKLFPSGLHLVAFEQNYGLVLLPSVDVAEQEATDTSAEPFRVQCYESAQAPGALGDMDTEAFRQYATRLLSWMTEESTWMTGTSSTPHLPAPAFQSTQAVHPPLHPEPMSFILADVTRHLLPILSQTTAPGFLGQEASTLSGPALLGMLLSSTLALPQAGSGVQTQQEVEQLVLSWVHHLLRLPLPRDGGSLHGHASAATLCVVQTARHASALPLTTPIRLYASEHAHPHVLAAARFLGLSETGGIRLLPVDGRGCLHARVVQAAVQEDRQAGWHPLLVIATLGTPMFGRCDPVAELAEICTREQLWLHVDATLYGGAAIDPTRTALLDGVEQASSLLIGLAPWLPIASGSTALWMREQQNALSTWGTLLSPPAPALPVWMVLRYFGQVGLVRRARDYLRLAHLFATWIDETPNWERLTPTVLHTVCFRAHPAGCDDPTALAALNRHLAEQVAATGRFVVELVVTRQVVALRVTIGNLRLLEEDLHLLCSHLEDMLHRFLAQRDRST